MGEGGKKNEGRKERKGNPAPPPSAGRTTSLEGVLPAVCTLFSFPPSPGSAFLRTLASSRSPTPPAPLHPRCGRAGGGGPEGSRGGGGGGSRSPAGQAAPTPLNFCRSAGEPRAPRASLPGAEPAKKRARSRGLQNQSRLSKVRTLCWYWSSRQFMVLRDPKLGDPTNLPQKLEDHLIPTRHLYKKREEEYRGLLGFVKWDSYLWSQFAVAEGRRQLCSAPLQQRLAALPPHGYASSLCSPSHWVDLEGQGSNSRLPACKAGAYAAELNPQPLISSSKKLSQNVIFD
ncbi:uncharacterized protein LOC101787838 [Cavia porcellus]|uniref:uncharacterized protein LOC101787838 n=1 Tax=Cavia porcellus TaxID=10141 RepID=UPI002FDF2E97